MRRKTADCSYNASCEFTWRWNCAIYVKLKERVTSCLCIISPMFFQIVKLWTYRFRKPASLKENGFSFRKGRESICYYSDLSVGANHIVLNHTGLFDPKRTSISRLFAHVKGCFLIFFIKQTLKICFISQEFSNKAAGLAIQQCKTEAVL